MKSWDIGLEPWILADGNYRDFFQGQIAEFALHLYISHLSPTAANQKSVTLVGRCRYRAVAEVIFMSEKVLLLDFGVRAFSEYKNYPPKDAPLPNEISSGEFLEVEFSLGIDPYFYFEIHHKLPAVPALIYTWQVAKIWVKPLLLVRDINIKNSNWLMADKSYPLLEIEATDQISGALEVETLLEGQRMSGTYILNCTLLDVAPQFQFTK